MWKFVSIVWLAVATPAFAQDDFDWETRAFDFADPLLNFSTSVVRGASIDTVPMNRPAPGTIGNIGNIGLVKEPREWLKVTIVGYALASPAAPEALCRYEIEADGYRIRNIRSTPDMTMTEAFATKANDQQQTTGAFTRCYARGQSALTVHVLFDVSDITTQDAYDARRAAGFEVYQKFVERLDFADGAAPNFGDNLLDVPVTLGEQTIAFAVPAIWDVPINDFTGPLPAEMQMLRSGEGGPTKGLMWLHVVEGDQPIDLEEVAERFVVQYFQNMDDAALTLEVVSNTVDDTVPELAARVVRVNVAEGGDIEASVIWHDGRLHVLGLWQNFDPPTDKMQFFTRLPALSSFVMMKNSLVRSLK
ncbi:hypothetical protein [Yoonia sp.]|uniref:hypothetical protein n=1 Tax=Yoonia sp. TaxID=2212373 RepID=UPI003266390F